VDKYCLCCQSGGKCSGFPWGRNGAGKSTTMKKITGAFFFFFFFFFFLKNPAPGTAAPLRCALRYPDTTTLQAQQQMGYLPEGAPGYGDMRVKRFRIYPLK